MTIGRYGIILALVVWTASTARAQRVDDVVIVEGSGTHRILVHPAYVSVLYFSSPVTHILISDQENFIVQLDGAQVILRPTKDAPPNSVANLHVLAGNMKVTVFLRITTDVDEAVSQVIFREPDIVPTGPTLMDRVFLSVGGIYGMASIENVNGGTMADTTSTSALFGAQASVGLAVSRHHSFELSVGLAQFGTRYTHFEQGKTSGLETLSSVLLLARLQIATVFHFGERVMPKFRLGASVQSREPMTMRREFIRDGVGGVVEGDLEERRYDMLMIGGIGIELPIRGDWRAGVDIDAMRSMGNGEAEFLSIEGAAFVRWL